MTNADRLLSALRASDIPLDDDALAQRCEISPRQQVNQICRRLEAQGLLSRRVGPSGKLVNAIRDPQGRVCLCGCGGSTKGTYQPGHDAKHAAKFARSLSTGAAFTELEREEVLGWLPSDALRAKALAIASSAAPQVSPPRQSTESPTAPQAPPGVPPSVAAGSSHEQRNAERVMLDLLGARLDTSLNPRRLTHPSGAFVEVDGASEDLRVLVECWAHQGPAKVAQKYKLVNDATKLAWIAKSLEKRPYRLILCVSDELAVAHLRGRSWQGAAIRELGVDIEVVELPPDVVRTIRDAQTRQYR